MITNEQIRDSIELASLQLYLEQEECQRST